jgi:hypothetical protein
VYHGGPVPTPGVGPRARRPTAAGRAATMGGEPVPEERTAVPAPLTGRIWMSTAVTVAGAPRPLVYGTPHPDDVRRRHAERRRGLQHAELPHHGRGRSARARIRSGGSPPGRHRAGPDAPHGAERIEVNLQFRTPLDPTGTIVPYRVRQTTGSSEYGVSGCVVYVEVVRQVAIAPAGRRSCGSARSARRASRTSAPGPRSSPRPPRASRPPPPLSALTGAPARS